MVRKLFVIYGPEAVFTPPASQISKSVSHPNRRMQGSVVCPFRGRLSDAIASGHAGGLGLWSYGQDEIVRD
jgi:hypothetical protein